MLSAASGSLGSLLPFAALAHRENRNTALSVSFRQFIQFILHLQRMSAPRPSCRNVHGAAICHYRLMH
jgi:hypothetical protein